MGRILVTGASGFIGKAFIDYLKRERKSEYDRLLIISTSKAHQCIETIIVPMNDLSKLERLNDYDIDVCFHLGAFTPKTSSEANNVALCNENILFTAALIGLLINQKVKLIFASTIDVYQTTDKVIDELVPAEPNGLYGWSKLYCEKMITYWASQNDKVIQLLRLGHIYGRGEDAYKKIIPETIRKLILNTPPVIYSKGMEKRSFIHINDCVSAIFKASTLDLFNGVINIVSDQSYSVKDIVETLISVSAKSLKVDVLGNDIPIRDFVFNNSKMREYLGEETVTLIDGLKDEYIYFSQKI